MLVPVLVGCGGGLADAVEDDDLAACVSDLGIDPDTVGEGSTDDVLASWSEPGLFRCAVAELDDDELQSAMGGAFDADDADYELTVVRGKQAAVRQLARDAAEADGEAEAVSIIGRMIAAYPGEPNEPLQQRIASLGIVEGTDGEIPGYAAYLRRTEQRDEPFALTRFEDEVIEQGTEPLRTRISDLQADIEIETDEARDD